MATAPDTWNLNTVSAATETDLITGTTAQFVILKVLTVCNYSGSTSAIEVKVTDSGNTAKAQVIKANLANGETLILKPDHFIEGTDKLRVKSAQANVSFYASGATDFSLV